MTENPLEAAAIAVARDEAPAVERSLEERFATLLDHHTALKAEVQGIHHFLTVFAEHLKANGVDITAQLPKVVTADELAGLQDSAPADAAPAAPAGGPGSDPNG